MRFDMVLAVLASVLGGVGLWLLLPHRHGLTKPRQVHALGWALAGAAGLMLAALWSPSGAGLGFVFFYAFALTAVAAAVLMITSKDPVASALWFAAVVLSTSGLFLLAGAAFLAVGTVIVYAGAIIVTFLFVIMLAQAGGAAAYDRAARMPARASLSCFLLLWALLYCVLMVRRPDAAGPGAAEVPGLVPTGAIATQVDPTRSDRVQAVLDRAVRPRTARLPAADAAARSHPGRPAPHVAGLGGTLFTDHLLAVEIAGAILFVALVGAAAIAAPKRPIRPQPPEAT